jgi:small conductance mechanosensitive channel
MEDYIQTSQDLLFLYAPKVIKALLVLFIGLYIINANQGLK